MNFGQMVTWFVEGMLVAAVGIGVFAILTIAVLALVVNMWRAFL